MDSETNKIHVFVSVFLQIHSICIVLTNRYYTNVSKFLYLVINTARYCIFLYLPKFFVENSSIWPEMSSGFLIQYNCIVSDFRYDTQYKFLDVSEKRYNTSYLQRLYHILSVSPLLQSGSENKFNSNLIPVSSAI
jgi:hypothetical protein